MNTKRWNDPIEPADGFRVLICRFRPRGVSKAKESWDQWWPELGPSKELLADFKGKGVSGGIPWATYEIRYLEEMAAQIFKIRALAGRVQDGEDITLLCSSSCKDFRYCHRTLLARILHQVLERGSKQL